MPLSTFLGGSGRYVATDMAFDASGNLYLVGVIYSAGFPVSEDVFSQSFTSSEGFVAKFGQSISYTVGGTISGLIIGESVELLNNGIDSLTASGSGSFVFSLALATGSTYHVTIKTKPSGKECVIKNGEGTIFNKKITNIQIQCSPNLGIIPVIDMFLLNE